MPLQRQHSAGAGGVPTVPIPAPRTLVGEVGGGGAGGIGGLGEITLTRDDILEWLKKQQIFSKVNETETGATKKCKDKEELGLHRFDPAAVAAPSVTTAAAAAKLLKRHSLGPNEEFFQHGRGPAASTDWIQYPLRQLKKHTFDPATIQSSCTDIRRKGDHGGGHRERKLRHSASEVVTSSQSDLPVHASGRVAPQKPERTFRYHHSRERQQVPTMASTRSGHFPQQYPGIPAATPATFVPQVQPPASKSQGKSHREHRSRRHRTQRSATVGDINQYHKSQLQRSAAAAAAAPFVGSYHHPASVHTSNVAAERSASMTRCADPSCSVMSLCDDPNCSYLYGNDDRQGRLPMAATSTTTAATTATTATSYYDTPRCTSLPRALPRAAPKCGPMCYECNNKCNSLPRCTDARCNVSTDQRRLQMRTKSNSLPRNAEHYQYQQPVPSHHQQQPVQLTSASTQSALATTTSSATNLQQQQQHHHMPRSSFKSATKKHRSASASGSGSNGSKSLTKSMSAASLNSRRRRHKTVHFGENLLREVCQNRKLIQPLQQQQPTPSGSAPLQPNIQMLYNFVEGVLSAWVDDEDDPNKSGPESEPERGAILKPMHRCNRARFQTIRRIVNEAAELKGSSKLGNSRYRHRHWRGTAKDCNERFLRKVCCKARRDWAPI